MDRIKGAICDGGHSLCSMVTNERLELGDLCLQDMHMDMGGAAAVSGTKPSAPSGQLSLNSAPRVGR